ncbi:hypothetical protein BJ170DRAFT_200896 [Xylariales sp. AK1849]|nr:hypothetical protein BJ170DRAFT_200896 [Xylariales sp. AK1849]
MLCKTQSTRGNKSTFQYIIAKVQLKEFTGYYSSRSRRGHQAIQGYFLCKCVDDYRLYFLLFCARLFPQDQRLADFRWSRPRHWSSYLTYSSVVFGRNVQIVHFESWRFHFSYIRRERVSGFVRIFIRSSQIQESPQLQRSDSPGGAAMIRLERTKGSGSHLTSHSLVYAHHTHVFLHKSETTDSITGREQDLATQLGIERRILRSGRQSQRGFSILRGIWKLELHFL